MYSFIKLFKNINENCMDFAVNMHEAFCAINLEMLNGGMPFSSDNNYRRSKCICIVFYSFHNDLNY